MDTGRLTETPTAPSPTRAFPDFNNNGVPDYQEGWFWRTAYEVGRFFIVIFAGEKTRARAAVDYIDGITQRRPGELA